MQLARGTGVASAEQRLVPAGLLEPGIDAAQVGFEALAVIAELQQLRIGELEQLECPDHAGGCVIDERSVPRGNDEVIGEIRQAVLQHFVAFLRTQVRRLDAQQARDVGAVLAQQRGS